MRPQTELFTLADRVFFEHPERWNPHEDDYRPAGDPVADGWVRSDRDGWIGLVPAGHELPWQGWKIHVSTVPDDAERCLQVVSEVAVRRRVPFKFLRRPSMLRATNLKYAPRSASGKFITLYPDDDTVLTQLLLELDPLVADLRGPTVLTDLRFREGPLHVRFGGFRARWCRRPDGERCLAVSRPDGVLVPDERTPGFSVPSWVPIPPVLAESLSGRTGGERLPYDVESALHFSNGGGVYLARTVGDDPRQVVLKEGRPSAGLSGDGVDAVTRLIREAAAMRALAGVAGVPRLIAEHTVQGHRFLAAERIPGRTLQAWVAEHHPLIGADPQERDRVRYVERAVEVLDRVRTILHDIHAAGYVMGDLHPGNILVDTTDQGDVAVGLVDLEAAVPQERAGRQVNGHAGFVGRDARGVEIDRHAFEVLKLWMLLPMTELLALAPDRRAGLEAIAVQQFPTAGPLLGVGAPREHQPEEPVGPRALRSMTRAVIDSATPERDDRLYPGDLTQFDPGQGVAFGHGAAGVLWALRRVGAPVPDDAVRWVERTAARDALPAGFLDGAAGVAHVLLEYGRAETARALLDRAADGVTTMTDVSLGRGLAGIGWSLLHTEIGDPDKRLDRARVVADRLVDLLGDGRPHGVEVLSGAAGRPKDAGTGAGLLLGWSGVGLFLLQLGRRTGDRALLDAAHRAVRRDLALCVRTPQGTLQTDGGFRSWPYVERGSAGLALVVDELLADVPDLELERALPELAGALRSTFVVDAHLARGRAGLMAVAARLATTRPGLGTASIAVDHLQRMHWHRVEHQGRWAFPGDGLHRLSMDYLTGTSGVLLAAASTVRSDVAFLPFLPAATVRRPHPDLERLPGADPSPFDSRPRREIPEGGRHVRSRPAAVGHHVGGDPAAGQHDLQQLLT